ncbi:hypothetical protein DFP72DRAFT_1051545 [Ephemerocybe angulata]|uniref:Uncharacterized protein n=1 Tax=Ephemerocybe angulata TaxID=980116 RepID=A0A8H6HEQ2_9AGAR|nr:hypothetical protein DFP72DRAFT_1051545 [Tulosesus angulatus]
MLVGSGGHASIKRGQRCKLGASSQMGLGAREVGRYDGHEVERRVGRRFREGRCSAEGIGGCQVEVEMFCHWVKAGVEEQVECGGDGRCEGGWKGRRAKEGRGREEEKYSVTITNQAAAGMDANWVWSPSELMKRVTRAATCARRGREGGTDAQEDGVVVAKNMCRMEKRKSTEVSCPSMSSM